MKKIESEELKKIQYDILLYIKEVCEKHHIKYFIAFGTLIGAVRHQGFIPWDDDIDVVLLREDYERLAEVMKHEQHEYYRFCDMRNMERCHGPYAIMEDKRTCVFHERFDQELLKNEGVSVDIFPLDDVPDNTKELKRLLKYQKFWKACNNLRISVEFSDKDTALKKRVKKITKSFVDVMGKEKIYSGFNKVLEQQSEGEYHLVADLMCAPQLNNCYRKELFQETVELKFEDDYFPAPKNYDEFLRTYYGDYMILPPEEERVSLHGYDYYWR